MRASHFSRELTGSDSRSGSVESISLSSSLELDAITMPLRVNVKAPIFPGLASHSATGCGISLRFGACKRFSAKMVFIQPGMLPSIKLVVIDDTPASLELVSEALQQDGLSIFTSTDPEEGLDLIFREHPQIVLLDLIMPKLSGLDVLERVVEFDPAIDVILMTAHYT